MLKLAAGLLKDMSRSARSSLATWGHLKKVTAQALDCGERRCSSPQQQVGMSKCSRQLYSILFDVHLPCLYLSMPHAPCAAWQPL